MQVLLANLTLLTTNTVIVSGGAGPGSDDIISEGGEQIISEGGQDLVRE